MSGEAKVFEGWAILELMGHRRLAGYVTEVELAGHGFLRLEVPDGPCEDCGHRRDRHAAGGWCGGDHDGDTCPCVHFPDSPVFAAAVTQFYSPSAVYALTPTTEELARAVRSRPAPVHEFELPRRRALAAAAVTADRGEIVGADVDGEDADADGIPF